MGAGWSVWMSGAGGGHGTGRTVRVSGLDALVGPDGDFSPDEEKSGRVRSEYRSEGGA